MRSFNTGIDNIKVETIPAEEYFGQDDKHLIDVFTSHLKATSRRWKVFQDLQKSHNSKIVYCMY